MRLHQLLSEMMPFTNFSSQTNRVWYNAKTGDVYSANDDGSHSKAVLANMEAFGVTEADLLANGFQPGTQINDYDGRVLLAAMRKGWVRIYLDYRNTDNNSNMEGINLVHLHTAALWLAGGVFRHPPMRFIVSLRRGVSSEGAQVFPLNRSEWEAFLQTGKLKDIKPITGVDIEEAWGVTYHPGMYLTEGNDYDSMFAKIVAADPSKQGLVQDYINWAKSTLKRKDRVIWFLRLVRVMLLNGDEQQREMGFLGQKANAGTGFRVPGLRMLQTKLEHYMSMPIAKIQNFQFGWQMPDQIFSFFDAAEVEWREARRGTVTPQEDDTIIMKFPDGMAWWLLDRPYCSDEGDAMGHCGNTASWQDGERILSLRKGIQVQPGEMVWRPAATFILDAEGRLGEMKGRGNKKPVAAYHPYIVALLEKYPEIKGIKGGGYAPEQNFSLSDLPEEEQDRLAELKPGLGGIAYLYRKNGVTPELIQMMEEKFSEYDVEVEGYDEEVKGFVVETFKDIDSFVEQHGSEFTKRVKGEFEGNGEFNFDTEVPDSEIEDFFRRGLPEEWFQKIVAYMQANMDVDEEDEDRIEVDWTDRSDVWDIIEQGDHDFSDLKQALEFSVGDGMRRGAENEMHDDYVSTIKDWRPNSGVVPVFSTYQGEDGKERLSWDGPVKLVLPLKKAIEVCTNEGELQNIYDEGWVSRDEEIDVEEPRYGWSGFDKDGAIEGLGFHVGELL